MVRRRLGWGGWVLMTVAMVLFWALLIAAVVLFGRYLVSAPRTTAHPNRAATKRRAPLRRTLRTRTDR